MMTPALARERAEHIIEMAELEAEQLALAGLSRAPSLSELRREAWRRELKAINDHYYFTVTLRSILGAHAVQNGVVA